MSTGPKDEHGEPLACPLCDRPLRDIYGWGWGCLCNWNDQIPTEDQFFKTIEAYDRAHARWGAIELKINRERIPE